MCIILLKCCCIFELKQQYSFFENIWCYVFNPRTEIRFEVQKSLVLLINDVALWNHSIKDDYRNNIRLGQRETRTDKILSCRILRLQMIDAN